MGKSRQSKRRRKYKDLNFTDLDRHKRQGKTLITPYNSITGTFQTSWRDDHAPEMLWAFLLTAVLPRNDCLACFREIVSWYRVTFPPPPDVPEPVAARQDQPRKEPDKDIQPSVACEIDHTSLAALSPEHFHQFIAIPLRHPLGYAALRPLLLIDALPGQERWRTELSVEPTDDDWDTLAQAVIGTLDHQSEKSTDVRWLKYVTKIVLHKMRFVGGGMAERGRLILRFPNEGDMRSVRPSIRAGELFFRRNPPSPWIEEYWKELFAKTRCHDPSVEDEYFHEVRTTVKRSTIMHARLEVVNQFAPSTTNTRADPRLDTSFGFVLYLLSLLEEISGPPMPRMLVGRLALRSMAEAIITFQYLLNRDDPNLWSTFRVYGAGKAKLAFLKLEEAAGELPGYVDQAALHTIANEDLWQEFLNIDLGHWSGKNLRELAVEGGTKDIYDKYYDWTSAFSHSQWGAIRDSNFVTCVNPMHRLHLIPRLYHRLLPSVVPDAIELVNKGFELLEKAYPSMEKLSRLSELAQPEEEGASGEPEIGDGKNAQP